jgi:PPK2 family polyphosphate:nucleotide phosphotransferase
MARKSNKPLPKIDSSTHRLTPGSPIAIADLPTRGKDFHPDRDAAENEFLKLRDEVIDAQVRLYAEGTQKLLIVFQAMDAGGKDGAIRHCFRGVNPQGVQVSSFKAPSTLERSHDYLWRIHARVPSSGMIGVFNRSHYEDVLVVRVDKLAPQEVWERRYDQINAFEKTLTEEGTRILKFFLHISRDEQKQRFEERLKDRSKHYKFESADVAKRKQWDDYMAAFEDVLNKCTTEHAPWHAIPSDQKWYRNLAIMNVIAQTLRDMDPQFPESDPGLKGLTIE